MYEDNDIYDNDTNINYSRKQNCIPQETVIRNVSLAAAYVPFQRMCNILPPLEGLKRGTIFIELYSPYGRKKREGNY